MNCLSRLAGTIMSFENLQAWSRYRTEQNYRWTGNLINRLCRNRKRIRLNRNRKRIRIYWKTWNRQNKQARVDRQLNSKIHFWSSLNTVHLITGYVWYLLEKNHCKNEKNHDFPAMNINGYQTKVAQRCYVRYVWEYAPQIKVKLNRT